MREYIVKRLLLLIPTLFLVSVLIFTLMRIVPGDYALLVAAGGEGSLNDPTVYEGLRQQFGLDKPLVVQYSDWVWRMVRYADLGVSFRSSRPVLGEILSSLAVTLELAIGATIVSLVIAIPTGVISAIRQDTGADYMARIIGLAGLSAPGFWIGTLLLIFPAFLWGYLPTLGYVSPLDNLGKNIEQFIFPSLALGASFAARVMRMTRSQMLEVLRQDYIRTAWSKGLRERGVLAHHALKNALIPVVTIVGVDFGYLLGRTVVIEAVFVLPGLGSSTLKAINLRDYPQVQGNILFIALMFVLVNLAVDLAYAWIDPRIRYG